MADPKNILIIEDDEILQHLYRVLLELTDYNVEVFCGDFRKITSEVDWNRINIVIADQMLGERVYGSNILEYLEKEYPHIRRVMLTGDSMINPSKTHCHILLLKPIHPAELIASLGENHG